MSLHHGSVSVTAHETHNDLEALLHSQHICPHLVTKWYPLARSSIKNWNAMFRSDRRLICTVQRRRFLCGDCCYHIICWNLCGACCEAWVIGRWVDEWAGVKGTDNSPTAHFPQTQALIKVLYSFKIGGRTSGLISCGLSSRLSEICPWNNCCCNILISCSPQYEVFLMAPN